MSAPFPNAYTSRLVAASDSKACLVCFKPTTTVLVASNKVDFFYICSSHLKDKAFAEPIHPEEYLELIKERDNIEKKVKTLTLQASKIKPYSWNKVMSNFGWDNGTNSDTKSETKNEIKKETRTEIDDKDNNNDQTNSEKGQQTSYELLIKETEDLERKVALINELIAVYKFKNFKLEISVYRNRINSHLQVQSRARRQQEVQTPGFFPLAPSHQLS